MKAFRLAAVMFILMFVAVSLLPAQDTAPFYKDIDEARQKAAGDKPVVVEFFADW